MKAWPWGVLSGVSAVLAGCARSERLPIPALDERAPAVVETATFALG